MKYVLALSTLLAVGLLTMAQGGAPRVVAVDHEKVAAALGKGGTLVETPEYKVSGSHRDKPGDVEVHDKETDVIYMIAGDATFVTGGTAVGLHQTTPGQSLGTEIKGGEAHHLTRGDVIVVPAGVPHWFKEVRPSVSYYVVKVIKP